MKPNTIYSKSGKGVQEASGKTSLLKRADRAVLSAIDGRATLGEVAQKVGKTFDAEFEKLISQLDKDGFVREVTAGPSSSSSQSRPTVPTVKQPAASAAKASADDLDFTTIMPAIKRAPAAAPPPPKAAARPDAAAQQRAKEQEAALYKARQEAEARAQAERDRGRQEMEARARAEAEAKIRAETEKKVREEASLKMRAEAEAKAKAAARIAAEARARVEAEAQAKLEAERKVREEIERKAREEAEKALREAEELRERLEAERKVREAEERERREEEDRRLREKEEAARRAREEEAVQVQQAREMEEARARARQREREQEDERLRKAQQETKTRQPTLPAAAARPAEPAKAGGGSLDALMADLDSFSQREEEERLAREADDRKVREDKKRKAQEEAERRAREQAAQAERERERAAEEARRLEEEERRAQQEAEQRVREAEEQRRLQAEERQRRALAARSQARAAAAAAPEPDIGVSDADLGMDDVRRDEAAVARDTRKAQRDREREARQREREVRERVQATKREQPIKYPKARRPVKWGRPVAILFFSVLLAAVGVLHIVPLPMEDYEHVASRALGRPVKIGSGRLSLFTGVRLNLEDITVGGNVRIASAHAYPHLGSLIEGKKAFRRIELDGVTIAQQAVGGVVTAKLRGRDFSVGRVLVTHLKLEGPVPLPVFEADAAIAPDGAVRSVTLRGPESLNARLTPAANGELEFDVTAANLVVPFVPELSFGSFAMKGTANRQGMNISSWGGAVLDGVLSGTASVRWTGAWYVDGAMTMRGINAAMFAPALLSEGKAEGSGRFSMIGADPAKLHNGARLEGNFTVGKGVLGTFDLARVLHTSGRQYGGRTQFSEMSGQAIYDRGAVALRNISITAGALNAGVSADIAPGGALAGRIVADIRTSLQPLRVTLVLGGTVKEPQVRN